MTATERIAIVNWSSPGHYDIGIYWRGRIACATITDTLTVEEYKGSESGSRAEYRAARRLIGAVKQQLNLK